jgi:hypothetical protein
VAALYDDRQPVTLERLLAHGQAFRHPTWCEMLVTVLQSCPGFGVGQIDGANGCLDLFSFSGSRMWQC